MKNKQSVIYCAIFAVVIAISGICVLLSNNIVVDTFSMGSTIFGVVGLLYSFHLDRNISEASFLFQLYQAFKGNEEIQKLAQKLEAVFLGKQVKLTEEDRHSIVEYITFFEVLGSMEARGVISINAFDALLGYDFFIAINNEDVKRIELDPFSCYYVETIRLAKKWERFRKKHNLPIPLENSKSDG
ncbi:MAG: hypothetical protein IJW09_04880 [Clostridia bacterium]|nr:hypothetical protein [Clostridia bacterium]